MEPTVHEDPAEESETFEDAGESAVQGEETNELSRDGALEDEDASVLLVCRSDMLTRSDMDPKEKSSRAEL